MCVCARTRVCVSFSVSYLPFFSSFSCVNSFLRYVYVFLSVYLDGRLRVTRVYVFLCLNMLVREDV